MPEPITWAVSAIGSAIGGTTGAAMMMYATEIAWTLVVASTVAASSEQQKRMRAKARASYNASLKDREVTFRSAVSPQRIIYGRDRVGGTLVYAQATGDKSQFLHMVVALAAHECDAIETIYFNDVALPAEDGNGFITTGQYAKANEAIARDHTWNTSSTTLPYTPSTVMSVTRQRTITEGTGDASSSYVQTTELTAGGTYTLTGANLSVTGHVAGDVYYCNYQSVTTTSLVRVRKYLGTSTQTADADLVSESGGKWTVNHRGRGICYLYVRLEFDQDVFGSVGVPNISAVVRGKKVYNPATAQTVWSENAALCVADFLKSSAGLNASNAEVPDAEVIAAAAVCDEAVQTTVGGATQPRYTLNTSFTSEQSPRDVLQTMLAAMAGRVVWTQGRWLIRPGAHRTPTVTITADSLAGPIAVVPKASRSDLFNAVRVTHRDPTQDYAEVQAPLVKNAGYQTADGGLRMVRQIELPTLADTYRAQRIGKIELERARQALTVTLTCNLSAYDIAPTDTVSVTLANYGWSGKVFECISRTITPQGKLEYRLRETAAGVWAWNYGEATVGDIAPDTDLPSPTRPDALTGLNVVEAVQLASDGSAVIALDATWTASTDAFVTNGGRIEVEWKRDSATAWTPAPNLPGTATSARVTGAAIGVQYLLRVRQVNAVGQASQWAYDTLKPTGASAVPPNVANLAHVIKPGQVQITWTPYTADDYDVTELRFNGTAWADASFLWAGAGSEYQHPRPANGTYVIRAKHRNRLGNYSAAERTTTVVVTDAAIDTAGRSTYTLNVFWTGVSAPSTPTSTTASYTFNTDTFTVGDLTAGWTRAMPAASGTNGIWMSSVTVTTTTPATPVVITSWSAPVLVAQRGTDGTNGASAIDIRLSNPAWVIPTDSAGSNGVYTGSGTTIEVWEGGTQLSYDGVGSSNGTWTFTTSASGITVGSITDSGAFATVGQHSNITADSASVTYSISGKRASGTSFSANRVQSLTRGKQGIQGNTGNTGTTGNTNVVVRLYQRSVTDSAPSVTTSGTATYTFASDSITSGPGASWTTTVPAASGAYLWMIQAVASSNSATANISNASWSAPVKVSQDGAAGSTGNSVALVYAYKRSASDLSSGYSHTLGPGACDYSFTTNTITTVSLANSWSKTIPAGTDPLYVTVATASSSSGTDSIASTDWATPAKLVENGATGADGAKVATVMLYQRTYTNAAPAGLPTTTLTFTFSTGAISGTPDNGWQTSIPSTGGEYLWVTRATALGTGSTDTISAGEWSAAQLMVASRAPVQGNSLQFNIRQASWDDQIANRVIHNIVTIAALTSQLATTTHLVRMDSVTLTNSSPWIRTAGAYSAGTAYRQGDIVISGGVAYRAVQNTTGNAPPNATYWGTYRNSVTNRGNWAGSTSYGANDYVGSEPDSAGVNTLWLANFAHTSTGTWASERNGGGFSEERYWDGSAWVRSGLTVDGSLLVRGSVFADALNVNKLSAVTADLGDITAGNLDLAGWVRVKAANSLTFTLPSGSVTQNVALASNTTSAAVWGVCGFSNDVNGAGIYGYNSLANDNAKAVQGFGGIAGHFQSSRDYGTAVRAIGKPDAANSTGSAWSYGLHASAAGTNNAAVYAEANTNLGGGRALAVKASGNVQTDAQLVSTVATGTAPLVVSSTTVVANLNAALLNGATFAAPGTIGSTTPSTGAFTSITVTSTSAVTNLNADMVDGEHASGFVKSIGANRAELGNTTTGSTTITFNFNIKPGPTGGDQVYIEFKHGGNTYWIPAWPN